MTARGSYRGTEQTRARIVAAAREVFARGGYDAASLRSIAAAAGMSHPGVLHHFPTKEALLDAVLVAHEEEEAAVFHDLWGSPTLEAFADAVAQTVALDRASDGLAGLRERLAAAGGDPQHPAHGFAVRRYQRLSGQFVANVERLREAGEMGSHLEPQTAADLLLGLLDGLGARGLAEPDLDVPELVRIGVRELLDGRRAGAQGCP